jgi:hypothetical protein
MISATSRRRTVEVQVQLLFPRRLDRRFLARMIEHHARRDGDAALGEHLRGAHGLVQLGGQLLL